MIDDKKIEEYLKSLQKALPDYNVTLDNLNDFDLLFKEKNNCKKCKNLASCQNENIGFYTECENDTFILKKCKYKLVKDEENKKNKLIKTLYIPRTIVDAKLDNFDTNTLSRTKIYTFINNLLSDWDNPEKCGLYLYGSFQIGKTYTLGVIANELAKRNIESLLVYFPDLIIDMKNALNEDNTRYEDLFNKLRTVDVLMLDDFGSENMTPWVRDEILSPILNYRMLEGKIMFISSNISPKHLIDYLAIDNKPQSKLKAERITNRLQSLVTSISMDDTEKYKR